MGSGARDFHELVCWQLAHQLKCEIFDLTEVGPASRDFKFRDQIRDSSASAPSNISEGFGRYRPREFAQYLRYAKASLKETKNHLIDARDRRYIDDKIVSRLINLAGAAHRLTKNLMLAKERQAELEDARRKRSRSAKSSAPSAKPPAPSAKPPAPSAKPPAPSAKPPAPSAKSPAPSAKHRHPRYCPE
jgi:four helix bundle protein